MDTSAIIHFLENFLLPAMFVFGVALGLYAWVGSKKMEATVLRALSEVARDRQREVEGYMDTRRSLIENNQATLITLRETIEAFYATTTEQPVSLAKSVNYHRFNKRDSEY